MFRWLILRLTHRLWNREISRILCRAHECRLVNSSQLHELAAAFDPTQGHRVYGACRDVPFANLESGFRNDGDGANFMGMIPRSDEPADKLAALEAQSGAMTSLSVAISRRLDACLSNPQAWESQMRTISECGAHLPSARWARLALIIEKCMPHLQEELRELEAMVSQNTGLKETTDSCNANS